MSTGYQFKGCVCRQILLASAILIATPLCFGQATIPRSAGPNNTIDRPSFEVATIRPFDESKHGVAVRYEDWSPTGLKMGGSVYTFIERAYGFHEDQILGGPGWSKNFRFDLVAKRSVQASPNQTNAMLRTLLEDRFKLAVHTETRDGPEYFLVAAKSGLRMKPADDKSRRGSAVGPGMLQGSMSTAELASLLSPILGRPVLDRSGVSGTYMVNLKWASDDQAAAPSVFTAIQEQLGLKLAPTRGPIQVLVIDHLEKPSEN